jgi:hypothetical protein
MINVHIRVVPHLVIVLVRAIMIGVHLVGIDLVISQVNAPPRRDHTHHTHTDTDDMTDIEIRVLPLVVLHSPWMMIVLH